MGMGVGMRCVRVVCPLPYDDHPIVVAMRSFRRHELRSVTRVMTCVRVEEGVLC